MIPPALQRAGYELESRGVTEAIELLLADIGKGKAEVYSLFS